jgi:hypothetical protein
MQQLTIRQAQIRAGIYDTDSDLEKDIKFEQYFRHYSYRVADTATHEILVECRQENLDFLITKEP